MKAIVSLPSATFTYLPECYPKLGKCIKIIKMGSIKI